MIKFIKGIIEKYNNDNQCGFCWRFYAPLTEKRLNIVRNDNCCVNVFLTRDSGRDFYTNVKYVNGYATTFDEFESYDLYFLIASRDGLNNYNELEDNAINESRNETIFEPLRKCITSRFIVDICNHYQLVNWSGKYIYDFEDENYYGLKISITQTIQRFD